VIWSTLRAVAAKDLRLELRSKVALGQLLPFTFAVLLLFGFALDPDRGVLRQATPGLFWITMLLVTLLAVQRSYAAETADGALDSTRLAGLPAAGVFLGKWAALVVELLAVEVVLAAGVIVLFDPTGRVANEPTIHWTLARVVLFVTTLVAATPGLAAVATLQGALAAGTRARDTLLPLLVLPVVAPVLIGATKALEGALGTAQHTTSEGWPWVGLLVVVALVVTATGMVAFGPLLEEDS
jgi:heme exporter protein B